MRKVYSVSAEQYGKMRDAYPAHTRFCDGQIAAAGYENLHVLPLKAEETIVIDGHGYPFAEPASIEQVSAWLAYAEGLPNA